MASRELRVVVPVRIFELLEKAEQKAGVKKEDLIMRALIKVLEEFGVS